MTLQQPILWSKHVVTVEMKPLYRAIYRAKDLFSLNTVHELIGTLFELINSQRKLKQKAQSSAAEDDVEWLHKERPKDIRGSSRPHPLGMIQLFFHSPLHSNTAHSIRGLNPSNKLLKSNKGCRLMLQVDTKTINLWFMVNITVVFLYDIRYILKYALNTLYYHFHFWGRS